MGSPFSEITENGPEARQEQVAWPGGEEDWRGWTVPRGGRSDDAGYVLPDAFLARATARSSSFRGRADAHGIKMSRSTPVATWGPGWSWTPERASVARISAVAIDDVENHLKNELLLRGIRHAAKRAARLDECGAGKLSRRAAGKLDAPIVDHLGVHRGDLRLRPFFARLGEEALQRTPLSCRAHAEQMNQHQGALALGEIAGAFLAVFCIIAGQVEDVVLDLERRAEVPSEPAKAIRSSDAPRATIAPTRIG